MKNLLYKDVTLTLPWGLWFVLCAGALLMIPQWPYVFAFWYVFFVFVTMFGMSRDTHDVMFTALLPVAKHDVVRSRILLVVIFEVAMIVASIPFAFLHNALYTVQNSAGMDINLAFYGLVFLLYALMNIMFFPGFYKTGYAMARPGLWAGIVPVVVVAVMTFVVRYVPALDDTIGASGFGHVWFQIPVFIVGLAAFIGGTAIACTMSAKRFEMVDL